MLRKRAAFIVSVIGIISLANLRKERAVDFNSERVTITEDVGEETY